MLPLALFFSTLVFFFSKKILCFTQNPTLGIKFSKRHLNLSVLTFLFNGFLFDKVKSITELDNLQIYTDSKNGFTLLVPSSWIKESTIEAEVVSVGERSSGQGKVYEFEYKIDSTRGGIKRVFSAAFVSSKKLYHSDKPEDPMDSSTRLCWNKFFIHLMLCLSPPHDPMCSCMVHLVFDGFILELMDFCSNLLKLNEFEIFFVN